MCPKNPEISPFKHIIKNVLNLHLYFKIWCFRYFFLIQQVGKKPKLGQKLKKTKQKKRVVICTNCAVYS